MPSDRKRHDDAVQPERDGTGDDLDDTNADRATRSIEYPLLPLGRDRRDSLRRLAGAVIACCAADAAPLLADDDMPRKGDRLVAVDGDAGTPLRIEDLKTNAKQTIAFAFDPAANRARSGSRMNRILLIRLDPDKMDGPTRERSAGGVLAYSAVCTHQSCDVSAWRAEQQVLLCFCHFSQFKPLEGADVVAGPAQARLAALPLAEDQGVLVVAGPFDKRPGPGG